MWEKFGIKSNCEKSLTNAYDDDDVFSLGFNEHLHEPSTSFGALPLFVLSPQYIVHFII